MNFSLLTQLVELCVEKGIRHAVLCPGSRSAPLTLSFTRNKKIQCWTFSDERSAAFIAVGMAKQTGSPVALVCTSGSAAYNFSPAVAEAFFQQIPLIVLTADRPAEWIDQLDGQTIRQKELFGNHVKKYFELPQEDTHPDASWHANRILNEAVNLSEAGLRGPVHINAPFREPLYPTTTEKTKAIPVRVIETIPVISTLSTEEWAAIKKTITRFNKILIVSGQHDHDQPLSRALDDFSIVHHLPVAGDILSNLHSIPFFCGHADAFLGQISESAKEELRPDLLITFGKSLIAKNLKLFLRGYHPKEHWHLQPAGEVADTFQALTKIIRIEPQLFFKQLGKSTPPQPKSPKPFQQTWINFEQRAKIKIDSFFKTRKNGEFQLVKQVLASLPSQCHLHLANSMAVRYANHIWLTTSQKNVKAFSNRGTSGIDGCSSTSVGHALVSEVPNVLITGDLAFFYDRNAYWHNYKLPNLFIVLLNNHGGIIFNLIDGPSGLPEAAEFFITRQHLNAQSLAKEFGFAYEKASGVILKSFFQCNGNAKILELDSSQLENKKIFEEFKKELKKSYDA